MTVYPEAASSPASGRRSQAAEPAGPPGSESESVTVRPGSASDGDKGAQACYLLLIQPGSTAARAGPGAGRAARPACQSLTRSEALEPESPCQSLCQCNGQ